MITATIAAESGTVKREVSRTGDRCTMTMCDTHGTVATMTLDQDGILELRVEMLGAKPYTNVLQPGASFRADLATVLSHAQGEQHAQAAGDGSHGPREA